MVSEISSEINQSLSPANSVPVTDNIKSFLHETAIATINKSEISEIKNENVFQSMNINPAEQTQNNIASNPTTESNPKKFRIVIIEDQTVLRQLLATLISEDPRYSIVGESGGGHESLSICLELKPDLVILDVKLPGLNGVDLLRRISRNLKETNVLVFSSYESRELIQEVLRNGARGFVEKNAPLSVLRTAIQHVAEGGCYFGPSISQLMKDAISEPFVEKTILSSREREVLQLIAEGQSTKKIALKLDLSVRTVENHRSNLMKKLNLHNVANLTRHAIKIGLTEVKANPEV